MSEPVSPGRATRDACVLTFAAAVGLVVFGVLSMQFGRATQAAITTLGAVALPAWVARMRWRTPDRDPAAAGRFGVTDVATGLVTGAGLAAIGWGFLGVVAATVPAARRQLEQRAELLEPLLRPDETSWIPVVIVVVALLPGVFEELLFRGVLRSRAAAMTATRRVLTLALLFAALHMNLVAFIPLFVVGVFLGLLAERTGGWAVAAVAHFTLNALNGVGVARLGLDSPTVLEALTGLIVGLLVATAGVAATPRTPAELSGRTRSGTPDP